MTLFLSMNWKPVDKMTKDRYQTKTKNDKVTSRSHWLKESQEVFTIRRKLNKTYSTKLHVFRKIWSQKAICVMKNSIPIYVLWLWCFLISVSFSSQGELKHYSFPMRSGSSQLWLPLSTCICYSVKRGFIVYRPNKNSLNDSFFNFFQIRNQYICCEWIDDEWADVFCVFLS